jgi:hypothetical protein
MNSEVNVLESFVMPKSPDGPGDDRIVLTDTYAAVVDGATRKHPGHPRKRTCDVICDAIRELPNSADLESALGYISAYLAASLSQDSTESASLMIYSEIDRRILVVGSGSVNIDGRRRKFGSAHEQSAARIRAAYLQELLLQGVPENELLADDPGRKLIFPVLANEYLLRNVDKDGEYYFGALDNKPVPKRFLNFIDVPIDAKYVCLASDGYPNCLETLELSNRDVENAIAEDPLMIGSYPMTKGVTPSNCSFDDRAYLRIRVGD